MSNSASDTLVSLATMGGLVTDAANPFTFEVTAQDMANGYAASNLIARGSTELLFGIATGGAASALGKGGKVAQLAGRGLAALDAGGNAYQAASGARDAYQNGLGFQNGAQMIGGALGFAGNVAGAARKAANTAKALDEVVEEGAAFAKTRVVAKGADYFDDLARLGTRNADSTKVVLGKFLEDGKSYVKVAAHYKASYLKIENWRELAKKLNPDELWKINKAFLQQQVKAGKEIILSHDPSKATGFFLKEVLYLDQLGFKFIKDGWVWKAVQ